VRAFRNKLAAGTLVVAAAFMAVCLYARPEQLEHVGAILAAPVGAIIGFYFAPRRKHVPPSSTDPQLAHELALARIAADHAGRTELLGMIVVVGVLFILAVGRLRPAGALPLDVLGEISTAFVSLISLVLGVRWGRRDETP